MTDPRAAAFTILRAVAAGGTFQAARDRATGTLSERDRRLAEEIAAGVLRHRRLLDAELKAVLGRRWNTTRPELQDVLRIGTYQLRRLTRVPPHAAVDRTVEVAKTLGIRPAKFVNAVLRRLLNQGPLRSSPGPGDPAGALAWQYSCPDWLVHRWLERYGLPTTEALLQQANRRPPLVLQPARWSRDRLESALAEAGVAYHEAPLGYGLAVESRQPKRLPGFAEGGFIVQGPAQARFVAYADIQPGLRVWDCCAAPGGKAVRLAARGPVLASDRGRERLRRLGETLRRAAPEVRWFGADARRPPLKPESLEAVWLDAPCTATGLLGRHPDLRWRLGPRRLDTLCRLQAELLDGVRSVVRRGGLLVYSTCSLEPEENSAQVNAFLARHPDFHRARDDLTVLPTETGSDGGYVAVLQRR